MTDDRVSPVSLKERIRQVYRAWVARHRRRRDDEVPPMTLWVNGKSYYFVALHSDFLELRVGGETGMHYLFPLDNVESIGFVPIPEEE